jgi:hypothetical protein
MNICIPTYPPHFIFVDRFIGSYYSRGKNIKNSINVIVSSGEEEYFKKYGDKVNVITLKELIRRVDGVDIDDNYLLNVMNKFSYQSIKKLYSALLFKDCIVLDSENECVNDFSEDTLNTFIEDNIHKIYYTELGMQPIQVDINRNSNRLIENGVYNEKVWMFVHSYWIYDSDIVSQLKQFLENTYKKKLYEIIMENMIFDYVLYSWWCLKNKEEYNIKLINIDNLLPKTITNKMGNPWNAEYTCRFLTSDTIDDYCKYLNNENILISRVHWMDEIIKNYIVENTNTIIGTNI